MFEMETLTGSRLTARPVAPPGNQRGIGIGELRLDGGFWGTLQHTNAQATLQHCAQWMERLGWLTNFDRVANGTTGSDRPGWQFSDSEVYKLLEALAWHLGHSPDPNLAHLWTTLVDRVTAAQDPDGYLNTCFGHTGQPPRYSDMSSGHELYCTGHLLQAAVGRFRTVGADPLVEVARRAADHVCQEFGPDARQEVCGHPEIEVGLVELGRALNEPRYLEQARLFIERRGHGTLNSIALLSSAYFQDDIPVRDADVWRGHAVRALYLAAGAVDVAVDLNDHQLQSAIEQQWARSVERRTYLTGGMGSRHQDEGFGEDWELPPDRAYCETCAGVASVMVSWRLLLATGEVQYADLIERTMYNVVATSPRADGQAFFYANPLHQRERSADVQPDAVNPRAEGGVRAPWFDVSCCPTNVARTLASWHTYAAIVDEPQNPAEPVTVSVVQYAAGDMRIVLQDGGVVDLRVDTTYPTSGTVRVTVREIPTRPVRLRVRVPAWATGATLTVSRQQPSPENTSKQHTAPPGWCDAAENLEVGQVITLDMPMQPRLTWPDTRIDAVRGAVAVERGPLVLCLESTDLPPGVEMEDVRLDTTQPPHPLEDGAQVSAQLVPTPPHSPGHPPYFPHTPGDSTAATGQHIESPMLTVALVPYYRWAERGPSTMRVFIPTC